MVPCISGESVALKCRDHSSATTTEDGNFDAASFNTLGHLQSLEFRLIMTKLFPY